MSEPKPPSGELDEPHQTETSAPSAGDDEPVNDPVAGGDPGEPGDDDELDDELDDEPGDDDDDQPLSLLSALKEPSPMGDFGDALEDKIRKRSGGRFFGERSLGDRTSIGIIAVLILAIGLGIAWMLRGSETGSLKIKKGEPVPELAPGARDVMPKP